MCLRTSHIIFIRIPQHNLCLILNSCIVEKADRTYYSETALARFVTEIAEENVGFQMAMIETVLNIAGDENLAYVQDSLEQNGNFFICLTWNINSDGTMYDWKIDVSGSLDINIYDRAGGTLLDNLYYQFVSQN